MIWVRQNNRAFSRPVQTSADAADDSSKQHEPFGAVSVVLVERRTVHRPAYRAAYESLFDANPIDENRRQDTKEAHQSKD